MSDKEENEIKINTDWLLMVIALISGGAAMLMSNPLCKFIGSYIVAMVILCSMIIRWIGGMSENANTAEKAANDDKIREDSKFILGIMTVLTVLFLALSGAITLDAFNIQNL